MALRFTRCDSDWPWRLLSWPAADVTIPSWEDTSSPAEPPLCCPSLAFPSFLKLLFTGKGFVTFHLQIPRPTDLSAQWQKSSGTRPQWRNTPRIVLCSMDQWLWISKPYQQLSINISVPGRNPLFPQPSWSGKGEQQLPSTYLVWTLWAALPELAGRVWLKPLAALPLSEYLDPKNISACYKEHQRTNQQPEPKATWDKVLPPEPKWNLPGTEPEQTFPGQGNSHKVHFKQPPV